MLVLVGKMSRKYHYKFVHARKRRKPENISANEIIKLIKKYIDINKRQPVVYEMHAHFINFSTYGYEMPIYINLIREPINRFVSAYYYVRQYHKNMFNNASRSMSVNKCIQSKAKECLPEKMFTIIPYFCGQTDFCLKPTRRSLDRAIQNAIKYYAVVGIMEEYNIFLKLLEKLIPQYFLGISTLFNKMKLNVYRKSRHLEEITLKNRQILLSSNTMSLEFEFYKFIKQRLLNY